jgi:aminodeoxyfutalosine deaminase
MTRLTGLTKYRRITTDMQPVTHRAGWIMIDPRTLILNGYVTASAGRILDAGAWGQGRAEIRNSEQIIDHGPGLLMPGLVNAHAHMELCGLAGKTLLGQSFLSWVESVIALRETIPEAELLSAARAGYQRSLDQGVLTLGDISTSGITDSLFSEMPVMGIWFREYLGAASETAACRSIGPGKGISIAGHGPHTTHPDFLTRLKTLTRQHQMPFSIHLAESAEETEFISAGKGPWADLLRARGIDFSSWKFSQQTAVAYANQTGLLDHQTLAVHLIGADVNDIRILAEQCVNVCLCPQSNQNLHGRLPNVPAMRDAGVNLCLGTDSPASNPESNLWTDMAFLVEAFPEIAPVDVLAMATCNGAAALGMGNKMGRLAPGFIAAVIYAPIHAKTPAEIWETLVHEPPDVKAI